MKKKTIIMSCLVVALLFMVAGIAYASFAFTNTGSANTITSGKINFSYTEPSNSYTISNSFPTDDSTGEANTDYFEFVISSNATTNSDDDIGVSLSFEISIESVSVDTGKTALTNDQIKVYLTSVSSGTETEEVEPILISELADSSYAGKVLLTGTHDYKNNSSAISTTYRLRAWIDSNVDASSWSTASTYQYKFRINVNANASSQVAPTPKAGTIVSGNINTVGSEVKIGDEHFYVIGDDENTSGNVKLLAKYLLNTTTNLQSESSYTTTSFADDEYWHDSNYDLIFDYGSDYPAYIYDNNCNYYQYIEAYNDNLIDLYDIDSSARLLKYEEAVALGCDPEATEYYGSCDVDAINNNDLDWIYDYTYFTGTASYSTLVWYIVDGGSFYEQEIGKSNYGIRPVISVAKNIF